MIHAVRDAVLAGEMNEAHIQSTFKDVFDSAALPVALNVHARSKANFHGDVPQHDVYAVDATGSLEAMINAPDSERLRKFSFAAPKVNSGGSNLYIDASGLLSALNDLAGVASKCFVGFSYERLSLFLRQLAHAYEVGLRPVSQRYVVGAEDSGNDSPSYAHLLSQMQNARPLCVCGDYFWLIEAGNSVMCWPVLARPGVYAPSAEMLAEVICVAPEKSAYFFEGSAFYYEPLRVINKSCREFSGHVFNASTKQGWYYTGTAGIVSHNCRCYASPVLPAFNDIKGAIVSQEHITKAAKESFYDYAL